MVLFSQRVLTLNTQELKKALSLSKELRGLGLTRKAPVKPTRSRKTPFKFSYEVSKPINRVIAREVPVVETKTVEIPQEAPKLEITADLVKEIVKVMHTLPEGDKLEVSKGIRNAQSFIYGGNKYGMHEMMHGAGSSTSSSTQVYSEAVAGSGTSWTLAHTPDAGTLRLYANGIRLTVTVDYTQVGTAITTLTSYVSGTLLADYQYA